ncbi:hypothetical protein Q9966_006253 [Columba livia]|nr:hypothetical protein Q9966_006253 [Columba livia]
MEEEQKQQIHYGAGLGSLPRSAADMEASACQFDTKDNQDLGDGQCDESRAHRPQSKEKERHCQEVKGVKWAQLPTPVPHVPHLCWMPPTAFILYHNCWQYWGKLMTCALRRLVPAKPLMCLLLMLVLQQEGKHSG